MTQNEDYILRIFNQSKYASTFKDARSHRISREGNSWRITVQDFGFHTKDRQSTRVFRVVYASPGVNASGYDFEEV